MSTTITLATVGLAVITEGVKFLYGQATELLKIHRQKKELKEEKEKETKNSIDSLLAAKCPDAFEGNLSIPLQVDENTLFALEPQLRSLRKDVSDYAEEIEEIDQNNPILMEKINALRLILESICLQKITFKGEQRDSSSLVVEGEIKVEEVRGYAIAVAAKNISEGTVIGRVQAKSVEPGGQIYGVKTDKIGH